jgi:hypothetical protein
VNALANILPINGYNTGQISGFYPNYFVPAGFTFGIWSVIYLLLITYTIAFTYYYPKKERYPAIYSYLDNIHPYYWATCIFNAGWILAWHYLQMFLSVALMLLFLFALIKIFLSGIPFYKTMSRSQRIILHAPFVVYFGWISVATIANITAMLVHLNWGGGGIGGIQWSILLIIIATALAVFISLRYRVISYELVVAWALWGIYKGQGPNDALLEKITLAGCILLLCIAAYLFLHPWLRIKNSAV